MMNLCKNNFSFSLGCSPDQRTACLDPYESGYLKKKECCQYSPPLEDTFDQCVGIIGMQATSSKLINSIYTQNEGTGLKSKSLNLDTFDLNRSLEPSSIISNSTFMGMFCLLFFIQAAGILAVLLPTSNTKQNWFLSFFFPTPTVGNSVVVFRYSYS